MSWVLGIALNCVIAVSYLLISLALVRPLVRTGQLRTNPLGAATAAIFLTCAFHHGMHALHMSLPWFGLDLVAGQTLRDAWTWSMTSWDVVGAAVAVYYWSLRRSYASLVDGAALFADFEKRERQALELNDSVLQGMVVARMALERGDTDKALDALHSSIDAASTIITDLLRSGRNPHIVPRRTAPAVLTTTERSDEGRA